MADSTTGSTAHPASGLPRELLAEMVGSYILCFLGPGIVAAAVLTGAHIGAWQVATVWTFAVALSIYSLGAISGCHINPAVTVAMAVYGRLTRWKVVPYISAQMVGGVLAALTLLALFGPTCATFEREHGIVRGEPGSQLSAMWFGEYFPNPATYGTDETAFAQVPVLTAFAAEALGAGCLLFFIMALTDARNPGAKSLTPLLVGVTVGCLISIIAPLTQAGLNPMRDFAPRLVAYFAGWKSIAIPGPRGCEWWLYIAAPLVGGLVGAGVHELVRPGAPKAGTAVRRARVLPAAPGPAAVPMASDGALTLTLVSAVKHCPRCAECHAIGERLAARFAGRVAFRDIPADSPEAEDYGVTVFPPMMILDDLVVVVGRVPREEKLAEIIAGKLALPTTG